MVSDGKLISNQYKIIMEQMIATGKSPDELVQEL
jgi:hypothetical protein